MLCTLPHGTQNEVDLPGKPTSTGVLPLSRQANERLLLTPLAKAKELVHNFLRLEEELLHAVFQLFVAALKVRIHCPQVHDGGSVEEVVRGQPFHKELEFVWKKVVKTQYFNYQQSLSFFSKTDFTC